MIANKSLLIMKPPSRRPRSCSGKPPAGPLNPGYLAGRRGDIPDVHRHVVRHDEIEARIAERHLGRRNHRGGLPCRGDIGRDRGAGGDARISRETLAAPDVEGGCATATRSSRRTARGRTRTCPCRGCGPRRDPVVGDPCPVGDVRARHVSPRRHPRRSLARWRWRRAGCWCCPQPQTGCRRSRRSGLPRRRSHARGQSERR
jgi:hypothetical protein